MRTLLALAASAAAGYLTVSAVAHDALPTAAKPNGWTYPFSCCSGYDCREVPADWIEEGPHSLRIVPSDEKIAYGDTRIKDSPDGKYHWCSVSGANDGRTICIYLPPRSY